LDDDLPQIKIAAVCTLPRIGWNDAWGLAASAFMPFQIPIFTRSQAFWGHAIQTLIEDRVDAGCDWVITFDYDSMFTIRHVDAMIGRIFSRPDIDALIALQCRRGMDETPLLGICGETEVAIGDHPIPVDTAHFGLTFLRCDALRKLPKPWFDQRPDTKGGWRGNDRTDADIWFWRRWKEAGFTAFVDPKVSIGHLQLFVSDFGPDFQPRHIHVEQWRQEVA
jgi:hypothetical protein